MKPLLISLILLGCSGPAFIGEDLTNEQGGNQTITSVGGGQTSEAGTGGSILWSNGGSAGAAVSQESSGGTPALAGRPAMGEGGNGGAGGSLDGGAGGAGGVMADGPRDCLSGWQSLDCARVCTNSASDCQAVINCYVSNNSLDNCSNFTTVGISLAQAAERNCCD